MVQLRVLQTALVAIGLADTRGVTCSSCKWRANKEHNGLKCTAAANGTANKTLIICYYCSEIDPATMSGSETNGPK